jgi:hypothetical protein
MGGFRIQNSEGRGLRSRFGAKIGLAPTHHGSQITLHAGHFSHEDHEGHEAAHFTLYGSNVQTFKRSTA